MTCTCWPHPPWCHQGNFSGARECVDCCPTSDTKSIFHLFEAGIAIFMKIDISNIDLWDYLKHLRQHIL